MTEDAKKRPTESNTFAHDLGKAVDRSLMQGLTDAAEEAYHRAYRMVNSLLSRHKT